MKKTVKRIILAGCLMASAAFGAGITVSDVTVSPENGVLGDILEVSGSFKSKDAVDAVVVLSQTESDFFRKKAKAGAGLEKTGDNEYKFFLKLSTRIKGAYVDAGEHILRMVVLDAAGAKIDNVVLCRIDLKKAE